MNRHHHPDWCAQGHLCSHDRGGDHRSHPHTIDTGHTRLVITRIRTYAGAERIDIRAMVDLPTDPDHARRSAITFLGRLHHAITWSQP